MNEPRVPTSAADDGKLPEICDTDTQQLTELKHRFKILKNQKSEIARQFKNATSDTPEHAALITAMQAVSSEIKKIEADVKTLEKKITTVAQPILITQQPPLFSINEQSLLHDEFSVRELTAIELPQWFAFLNAQKNIPAYHSAAWVDAIADSFGNPTRIWVATASGNIVGGLPLTFFSSKLFGTFAVSTPYVNYGGVISPYFNVAKELLAQLPALCAQENLSHIEVRTMQPNLAAQASSKKASMILALPDSTQQLDENLGAKVRAQYNKAEEHSPTIQFGKLELLDDFYRVFAQNMRDLGTPIYSKQWFANILRNPAIDARLTVVYVNKKPVSTGFLVGNNKMLEIPWASTIKAANTLNTNMWMYRQILGYAINNHFKFFDFGRSTQDAGTYKFKKQWGAQPYVHYWYNFLPSGNQTAPELNPDNPKFKLMISLWKLMPVWLTQIIGPSIIKHIP